MLPGRKPPQDRRGYCSVCWLPPSEREELEEIMTRLPVPAGTYARYGINRHKAYAHRSHMGKPRLALVLAGRRGGVVMPWRTGECGREQGAKMQQEAEQRRQAAAAYAEAAGRRR